MAKYKIIRVNPVNYHRPDMGVNLDLLQNALNEGWILVRVDSVQGESRTGNSITSNDYLLIKKNGNDTNVATIDQ